MTIIDQYKQKEALTIHQEQAWLKFMEQGFPNKKIEAFKYNKLSQNDYQAFNYLVDKEDSLQTDPLYKPDYPVHAHLINGQLKINNTHNKDQLKLGQTHQDQEQDIACKNEQQTTHTWNTLHDINRVFSRQGYQIDVMPNTNVEETLVIQHSVNGNRIAINNRNKINVGKNSKVTIVEFFSGQVAQDNYFQNQTLSIHCDDNAHLTLIRIQDDVQQAIHQSSIDVFQNKNSTSNIINFSLGAYRSRLDASVQLLQDNAQTNLSGLYFAKNKQFHDHYTNIYHGHANTFSSELFKGILNDTAEAAFAGKIYVEKDAQKIESKQMNRNLMLSDDASSYSVPQLEIFADDVKCAHGSTVGELDLEQLFYLRSRGFSEYDAKLALIQAYANEVTEQCKVDFVQSYINTYLLDNLFKKA
ncbi:Fe-S cluster assembly protein SufD [bacterium]|nr:Fe-S cluster assembly protein SufD [bacterium]